MSSHYTEDDLTLYYYGEGRRRAAIERHLQTCAACATLYREIAATLAMVVAEDVPDRGEQYGLEVWQRIRHRLPEQDEPWLAKLARLSGFTGLTPNRLALAGGAALVIVAFIAGRTWRESAAPAPATVVGSTAAAGKPTPAEGDAARQRILLTAVADHLDRSERVLTDIMNTPDARDISVEQRWAEDLLTTSRLYRQDAAEAGEQSVASVLDELERNLLEIVHSPSKIGAAELEQLRRRIDAAALLFKVRVMGDELRRREAAPAERPSPRTSTSKTS